MLLHQQNVQFLFSYLFLLLPYLCMKRYAKVHKSCKSRLPYLFLPFVGVSRPSKTCKSGAKGVALCKRMQKEKHVFLMNCPFPDFYMSIYELKGVWMVRSQHDFLCLLLRTC